MSSRNRLGGNFSVKKGVGKKKVRKMSKRKKENNDVSKALLILMPTKDKEKS